MGYIVQKANVMRYQFLMRVLQFGQGHGYVTWFGRRCSLHWRRSFRGDARKRLTSPSDIPRRLKAENQSFYHSAYPA